MKRILLLIGIAYICLGVFLFLFQGSFIYQPGRTSIDDCPGFEDALRVKQGITRLFFKENSNTLVVFYHGNAGNVCDRLIIKEILDEAGVSYVFPEYFGYGGESGTPSKEKILENVRDTITFIEEKTDADKVVVIGESLGAAAAAYHTTQSLTEKLLLISPMDRLLNVVQYHEPIYPARLLLREDYNLVEWIRDYEGIVKIMHGGVDNVIPIEFGRALYDEIQNPRKEFAEIQKHGHNDLYDANGFDELVLKFL